MILYNQAKMATSVVGFYFLLLVALCSGGTSDQDVKLRFYFNSFDNFTELSLNEVDKIMLTPWYNASRQTVIYSYGYTGKPTGPAVTEVLSTYLELGESNVALLDWEYLASVAIPGFANSYTNWAVPNARQLGVDFADTLVKLSEAGLDLNKVHLIGHSLGAHLLGITGNTMRQKGIQLPWITGLDPSSIGFENKPPSMRLSEESARYVDVIHTDHNKYGIRSSCGTVDFWPNYRRAGHVNQPGCRNQPAAMFSAEDLCSHNRSWQLLISAIKQPGLLIGSYARNYRTWKNYSEVDRRAVTLLVGKYYSDAHSGNYYFITDAEYPYGLADDGL